jgi:predicted peptidase
MRHVWTRMALVAVVSVGGYMTAEASKVETGFINKTMTVDGQERRYVVYVPHDYDSDKPWPLVMFLHGAGERGDDGLIQTAVGIGNAIRRNPERFPCLVVMPQCPKEGWWSDDGTKWAEELKAATTDIDVALAATGKEYNVDPARIYLTGLSMGGYGTWVYGAKHTDTYAAFMPICGGGRPEDAKALAKAPIRAFHGTKDSVVPVDRSREMVAAVKQAGGDVELTEYPDTDHNSWDQAYGDAAAIAWLLKQRKGD